MSNDYKTYLEWAAEGRQVRAGEKAPAYWVEPYGKARLAAFTYDQTEERTAPDHAGWNLFPVADLADWTPARKPRKIKVNADTEHGTIEVWVGANEPWTQFLKSNGYAFRPRDRRFVKHADDPIGKLRGFLKYAEPDAPTPPGPATVELTVDGNPPGAGL